MRSRCLEFVVCLFLVLAVVVAYWPVYNCDFINLDDDTYVTENPNVQRGLSKTGFVWAFTTFHGSNWHPLTWLSHMLDCELFGLKAGMHHLTNLLFHIANSILLFVVFRRMTGALWQSAFVAALFAIHPLHVESVAWVAERKDVLSTFFWMLTLWAYVSYTERPGVSRYIWVVILFALGLMAKPMVVSLPFVLLLMDYWPLDRFKWGGTNQGNSFGSKRLNVFQLIWEKIPLFALSLFSCVMTFLSERGGMIMGSLEGLATGPRIANALVSYISYIRKMFWPLDLAVFYPHPETVSIWKATGAGLLLLFMSIMFVRAARSRPYFAVGWLWYLGTLIPVIGIVQVGWQAMADRYTYIPLIGLFILISWGASDLLEKWRHRKKILGAAICLLLSICMVFTWFQVRRWKDSMTLFRHAINVTSGNYLAHNNLGVHLVDMGRHKEAITHYSEALKIKPGFAGAYNNLGVALAGLGQIDAAIAQFFKALRLAPKDAETYNNLGSAFANRGNIQEAVRYFAKALRIRPHYAEAQNNLGNAFIIQGNIEKGIEHLHEALRIKPDDPKMKLNIERVLLMLRKADKINGIRR